MTDERAGERWVIGDRHACETKATETRGGTWDVFQWSDRLGGGEGRRDLRYWRLIATGLSKDDAELLAHGPARLAQLEAAVERLRFAIEYASQMASDRDEIQKYLRAALAADADGAEGGG